MIFVKNSRGGREVNMINSLSQIKGDSKCLISNAAQLHSTVKIIFLLARTMSVLLCQPIGKQTEVVLSDILR